MDGFFSISLISSFSTLKSLVGIFSISLWVSLLSFSNDLVGPVHIETLSADSTLAIWLAMPCPSLLPAKCRPTTWMEPSTTADPESP